MRRLPSQRRACTRGEQKRLPACIYNAGVPDVEVAVIFKHFHGAPAIVATRRHPVWQKAFLRPQVKLQKGK